MGWKCLSLLAVLSLILVVALAGKINALALALAYAAWLLMRLAAKGDA